ncbi:MAG: hypothetical protein JRN15_08840 [Nitrososphaerota archaeon]|nr:hypothetical protein [Nitrososphaerota archaeon]
MTKENRQVLRDKSLNVIALAIIVFIIGVIGALLTSFVLASNRALGYDVLVGATLISIFITLLGIYVKLSYIFDSDRRRLLTQSETQ